MKSIENKRILILLKNNEIKDIIADKGIIYGLVDENYPNENIPNDFIDLYNLLKKTQN
jgi:hypothetical protein